MGALGCARARTPSACFLTRTASLYLFCLMAPGELGTTLAGLTACLLAFSIFIVNEVTVYRVLTVNRISALLHGVR